MVAAVIFDVFGTVVEIRNRQNPYRQLVRLGAKQGRAASSNDLEWIMTHDTELHEAADALGIHLGSGDLALLKDALELELQSIQVFDDAWAAIELLRASGTKIGVCSNLAGPYCREVRRLLPGLDAYALSAECGVMKPDPIIYRSVCSMLGIEPGNLSDPKHGQVYMVGDSKKCDEQGPRACGIVGTHLDRYGAGRFQNLLEFAKSIVI
ncbi:HAD family hydrolase [Pseudomonas sp. NBRC 111119]|uniref:HAD family hydrolase n=1 Tax=Pseudomonas sp. NBRC 111119 TaxID=1661034 RepID=UPI000760EB3E|nr:HAD family hydrolase [Pseudomonas sp. NBRC 111119]